jgi:hypothetical protein
MLPQPVLGEESDKGIFFDSITIYIIEATEEPARGKRQSMKGKG